MAEAKHLEESSSLQSREGLHITGCFSFNSRHMLSIRSAMLVDVLPEPYTWNMQSVHSAYAYCRIVAPR